LLSYQQLIVSNEYGSGHPVAARIQEVSKQVKRSRSHFSRPANLTKVISEAGSPNTRTKNVAGFKFFKKPGTISPVRFLKLKSKNNVWSVANLSINTIFVAPKPRF